MTISPFFATLKPAKTGENDPEKGIFLNLSAYFSQTKWLTTSKIGSAGLDVYEEESEYFFEDKSTDMITDDILARLLTFPNVLLTSHQGFFTVEALRNIAQTTLNNLKEFFDGGYLENEICYKCEKPCLKKQKKRCF